MTITNEFLNYEGLVVYDNEIRNYIDEKTAYIESDPTVPDHVKNIATGDISNWNSKSNFSGNYDDLTNKPTLGTLAGKSQVEKMDLSADLQTAVDRVDFAAGGIMSGSLTINGDLTVNGTSTTVETYNENVNVENNTITLRYNATTGLQNGDYTGIVAQNYDGANNGMLVFDNSGTAYVGDAGDLQPLATRAFTDSDDGALTAWDASAKTLIKAPVEVEDIITKDNVDSFNKALSTAIGDNDIAYQKDVPENVAPNAVVTKLGGMTYKSKNLLNQSNILDYVGCEIINGEDELLVTVSNTDPLWFYGDLIDYFNSLPKGQYYFYSEVSGGAYAAFWVNQVPILNTKGYFNMPENLTMLHVELEGYTIGQTYTVKLAIYKVQKDEYEPYYEGLRSAKVTEVKSVGANLFDVSKVTAAEGSISIKNDSVYHQYTANTNYYFICVAEFECKPNTNYSLSWNAKSVQAVYVYTDRLWGNSITAITSGGAFNSGNNTKLLLGFYSSPSLRTENSDVISNIMLKEGASAPYTPYIKRTLPIPEAVRPANGINENVYDFIEWAEDGSVKKVVKCGVEVFDGSADEAWDFESGRDYAYAPVTALGTARNPIFANKQGIDATWLTYGYPKNIQYGTSGTPLPHFDSIEEFRAWLAVNPLEIVYELAEPIVTDISDLITADNLIGVEGGGTLTFENEHKYAVPSEVVFYNEKAEAIAADKIVGNLIGVSTRAISDEDGNSIANTYMKKSNALEVISGLTETQLQKLISLIDTIEIQ